MAQLSPLSKTTRDALILLPDVWSVLLDPSKKVVDDTCLEKLLSWMAELADSPAVLKNLLVESSDIVGFLRKALHPDCNATSQVFALRLSAVLLNSLNGLSAKTPQAFHNQDLPEENQVGFPAGERSGSNRNADHDKQQGDYICVIGDLVEKHLVSSFKSAAWRKASIRNAWFDSARALVGCRCPSGIHRQGVLDITLESLEDNCLFVISAAQHFLADLITAMHTCSNPLPPSRDETANKRLTSLARDRSEDDRERPRKRSKQDPCGDAETIEKTHCDCLCSLKACLQRMTAIMTPAKPRLPTNHCPMKLIAATLGVWSRLLESRPLVARAVLTDVSSVSIISELLQYRSHTSSDMCSAIVEFVSLYLQALHDHDDSDTESELVAVVIGLPMKLMNIHQFTAAIQLASNLFSCIKMSKVNGFHFQVSEEDSASLLRLVTLPMDCLLIPSDGHPTSPGSSSLLAVCKERLLEEMRQNKCRCLTLLCQSSSAVQRIIGGGRYTAISQLASLADQAADILSLTLGQRSPRVVTDTRMRRHLQGSVKVTKAVLGLATTIVASGTEDTGPRNATLLDTSLAALFLQLVAVLTNPDSDPTVISKSLDVLALLLPASCVKLNCTDLMTTLAETVTKRLCDPQWAVRDSVVSFLQGLLRAPTDELCSWFKRHRLHVRILDCIHDGESFVRATAMNTLVDISKQDELWKDLLLRIEKTEIILVGEFLDFLLDSPGFLRRATVNAYTQWLKVLPWLETGLPGRLQGSTDATDEKRDDTEIIAASRIRSAVSAAMFDLDWEVKHGALAFWQTLLEMYAPARNAKTSPDANKQMKQSDRENFQQSEGNDLREVGKDSNDASMLDFLHFLKEEALAGKLVAVLDDEDPTVARRACRMLLDLYDCLPEESTVSRMNYPGTATFARKLHAELEALSLRETLDEKNKMMETNGLDPLSLLQDILTGTEENDCKFLDCY